MSVYMTEEEQLLAIKNFWKKHQRLISIVLSVVLLCTAGVRYWQWHTEKRDQNASILYQQLMQAFSENDQPSIQAHAKTLGLEYAHTVYGDAASLMLAKLAVDKKDWNQAINTLKKVAMEGQTKTLRDVAKYRLARIFLYQKAYDDALSMIDDVDSVDAVTLNQLKEEIHSAKKLS